MFLMKSLMNCLMKCVMKSLMEIFIPIGPKSRPGLKNPKTKIFVLGLTQLSHGQPIPPITFNHEGVLAKKV